MWGYTINFWNRCNQKKKGTTTILFITELQSLQYFYSVASPAQNTYWSLTHMLPTPPISSIGSSSLRRRIGRQIQTHSVDLSSSWGSGASINISRKNSQSPPSCWILCTWIRFASVHSASVVPIGFQASTLAQLIPVGTYIKPLLDAMDDAAASFPWRKWKSSWLTFDTDIITWLGNCKPMTFFNPLWRLSSGVAWRAKGPEGGFTLPDFDFPQ